MQHTNETKVKMFGDDAQHYIWRQPNISTQHQHFKPTIEHSGTKQIYNRTAEKEKNRGAAMAESKSRHRPD